MLRKTILALSTAAALSAATLAPTSAFAGGGGGGWHGGGWHGGGYGYQGPEPSPTMTAVGLLCRLYSGIGPRNSGVVAGVNRLRRGRRLVQLGGEVAGVAEHDVPGRRVIGRLAGEGDEFLGQRLPLGWQFAGVVGLQDFADGRLRLRHRRVVRNREPLALRRRGHGVRVRGGEAAR